MLAWLLVPILGVVVYGVWKKKESELYNLAYIYKREQNYNEEYKVKLDQLRKEYESIAEDLKSKRKNLNGYYKKMNLLKEELGRETEARKALEFAHKKLNEELEENNSFDLMRQLDKHKKEVEILKIDVSDLQFQKEELEDEVECLEKEKDDLIADKHVGMMKQELNRFGEVKRLSHRVFEVVDTGNLVEIPEEFFNSVNNPVKLSDGYEYYQVDGEEVAIPITVCDYLRRKIPGLFGLNAKTGAEGGVEW